MKMNHVCLMVKDFEKELEFYRDILGLEVLKGSVEHPAGHEDTCPSGKGTKMLVAVLGKDGTNVELIHDTEFEGEYYGKGDSQIEHICFEVDDLDEFADKLKEKGTKFTREVYELGMFDIKKCSFIEDPEGVRIELIERE